MPSRKRQALLGTLLLALPCFGCRAQRELRIRSEPPGAMVRVDDTVVGRTPLALPFEHYGVRHVSVYLEGFRTASRDVRLKTPWYSVFPLDLVSEVLLPFGWADSHVVEFELEPEVGYVSEVEFRDVLERAETLRRAGPAGPAVPLPGAPPPAPAPAGPSSAGG